MHISVIIPTKDRKEILSHSLDKLAGVSNLNELEIIIVNDSENELLLENKFDFVTIYNNDKAGVASARNFGAAKANYDWLVFMDDDMWVEQDTFRKLEHFCVDLENCLNVNWIYPLFLVKQQDQNPFLRYLKNYGFDSLEGWSSDVEWNANEIFEVKGITSQFLLIHKNTFKKVGGYNTSFPFAGFEDYDMSKRLKASGVKVYVDPKNMIYHNEADRIDIENWLERKKRGAVTRRVGIELGYNELRVKYPLFKRFFYRVIYGIKRPLLAILKKWPNTKALDRFFFMLVNIMLGTYLAEGYHSSQARTFVQSIRKAKNDNSLNFSNG